MLKALLNDRPIAVVVVVLYCCMPFSFQRGATADDDGPYLEGTLNPQNQNHRLIEAKKYLNGKHLRFTSVEVGDYLLIHCLDGRTSY